jgi:hypothetical protein
MLHVFPALGKSLDFFFVVSGKLSDEKIIVLIEN